MFKLISAVERKGLANSEGDSLEKGRGYLLKNLNQISCKTKKETHKQSRNFTPSLIFSNDQRRLHKVTIMTEDFSRFTSIR